MIKSITIKNTASFGPEEQSVKDLAKINFFFGSNGAGKTTLSRVIADPLKYKGDCSVNWSEGRELHPFVYNSDFVEHNFHQKEELEGVFTLGEDQVEVLEQIQSAKGELEKLAKKKEELTQTLEGEDGKGGKHGELNTLEDSFKAKCWSQKQKYDPKFKNAFQGVRSDAEKFKGKVLAEQRNQSRLLPEPELERKAQTLFESEMEEISLISDINTDGLFSYEKSEILGKRIVGREDIDISGLIKKLGNSDWVNAGHQFYDKDERICPFCQQETSEDFAKSLSDYFDESFIKDRNAIKNLKEQYTNESYRIIKQLTDTAESGPKFLDIEQLKNKIKQLDDLKRSNLQRISKKLKEPSCVVEMKSTQAVLVQISGLIRAANLEAEERNRTLSNLKTEREDLTSKIWRFVIEELKSELDDYSRSKKNLESAIRSIENNIESIENEKGDKQAEIKRLEKRVTSSQPTVDAINQLLLSFDFNNFSLVTSKTGDSYQLLRQDGAKAKSTLSEGEKTFVAFLYFYHLTKNDIIKKGVTKERVIVFDDPVSSLDSEILFIVSSLIKNVFKEVRAGSSIKQIFVLTHNVYFHKEVSYNSKRRGEALSEETFWIVRKTNSLSRVERYSSNPITSSYDSLWAEIRRTDKSNSTIQNVLRRILENYFKILGGFDLNKMIDSFEGKDKCLFNSLIKWANDGSHFVSDDVYVSIDDNQVKAYLRVFKNIFEKSGHESHYKMMMRDYSVEDVAQKSGSEVRK